MHRNNWMAYLIETIIFENTDKPTPFSKHKLYITCQGCVLDISLSCIFSMEILIAYKTVRRLF